MGIGQPATQVILADNALLAAFVSGTATIGPDIIHEVVKDRAQVRMMEDAMVVDRAKIEQLERELDETKRELGERMLSATGS